MKKKLVYARVGHVRPLGDTTTNKVDFVHGRLKKWLEDSKGDFCKVWEATIIVTLMHHNVVHISFGKSITIL